LFNKVERLISSRNLKPKKKESFLKIISLFSFVGIMLGVAILIIVMSVMNGFRTDLTNKILGLNPHITIEPASSIIDNDFIKKLKNKFNNIKLTQNFNGQAISMTKNSAKGLLVKSLNKNNLNNLKFLKEKIITGDYQKFKKGSILIGRELSYDLDLSIGDSLTLMSSSFISTPLGEIPKQESYEVVGIFSSGFYEFDQNVVFLNISDVLSLFNKSKENLNIEIFLKDPSKANIIKEEI
jgi:lipoprotein-releasing system permease protein